MKGVLDLIKEEGPVSTESMQETINSNPVIKMLYEHAKEKEQQEREIINLICEFINKHVGLTSKHNYSPLIDKTGADQIDGMLDAGEDLYNACAAWCRIYNSRKEEAKTDDKS